MFDHEMRGGELVTEKLGKGFTETSSAGGGETTTAED